MTQKRGGIILASLILFASLSLSVTLLAAGLSYSPISYLPVVVHSVATPTPTPVPTGPRLKDGHYYAELKYTFAGNIEFKVKDRGGTAYEASFLYIVHRPLCPPRSWSFPGSTEIDNGFFSFAAIESQKIIATMECTSLTSTSANCSFQKPFYDDPFCGRPTSAILHRQD